MCSFIFSTILPKDKNLINRKLKSRGPDHTNIVSINKNFYIHNILSLTGEFTPQPIINKNICLLFNGQIYNYKDFGNYDCDTDCIIPLFMEYGEEFINKIDGEYSICIIDYSNNLCYLYSDIFRTKPLFYAMDASGLVVSTYTDPIKQITQSEIVSVKPSEYVVIDLNNFQLVKKNKYHTFDILQHKSNYDDWIRAFELSISKRIKGRSDIFIGLSSGYDSGAIACELSKQNCIFNVYSHVGKEDFSIIKKRINLLSPECSNKIYKTSKREVNKWANFIDENCDNYFYEIYSLRSNYNEFNIKLSDDNGAKQFAILCNYAKIDNRKVNISSVGADEIYSDYGFNGVAYYAHSNFGGKFPEDLNEIFPWPSFYGSSLASYIAKEEYVAGLFGIENRYPFLDKNVIQEFLWLKSTLKNAFYKNVIHYYLSKNKYPFAPGVKIGF